MRSTTRTIAVVIMTIGLGIAYLVWPSGVLDIPIGSMPFGSFLRVLGAGVIVVAFAFMALLTIWD